MQNIVALGCDRSSVNQNERSLATSDYNEWSLRRLPAKLKHGCNIDFVLGKSGVSVGKFLPRTAGKQVGEHKIDI